MDAVSTRSTRPFSIADGSITCRSSKLLAQQLRFEIWSAVRVQDEDDLRSLVAVACPTPLLDSWGPRYAAPLDNFLLLSEDETVVIEPGWEHLGKPDPPSPAAIQKASTP